MRNPSSTLNRGFIQLWPRRVIRTLLGVGLLLLAALSILYFRQHSMVYHPRPYDESYAYAFPANGVEINYTVATAKYCAYYIPATAPFPKRLWIAFSGNGSLALDWTQFFANIGRTTMPFFSSIIPVTERTVATRQSRARVLPRTPRSRRCASD